ncbi:MAG: lipid II flippase MurJ [Pseudomonadota bacterium]
MSLLRISLILTIIAMMSRGLGLARDLAITYVYGATPATDSFYAATSLVYAAHVIIGASLTGVTVPFLREGADDNGREAEFRTISSILNVTILALSVLTVFGMVYADVVARALIGTESATSTAGFIFILMPSVILLGAAGILSGILNQSHIFVPVSAAPALLNLFVIIAVLIPWRGSDVHIAIIGTLIGSIAFFLIQIPRLYGVKYRHNWRINLDKQQFSRFFGPAVPVLAVSFLTYSYTFVDIAFASRLGEGIVTAVNVATKLIQLPQGVIAMGLTAATFPLLSAYIKKGELSLAAQLTGNVSLTILFLALPTTAFMVVTSDLIIGIVFGKSAFTEEALDVTMLILRINAMSLPALALNIFLLRVFYAKEQWRIPLLAFATGFAAKCLLSYTFVDIAGVDIIAISTVLSVSLTTLIMTFHVNSVLQGAFGPKFTVGLSRILVAASGMAALLLFSRKALLRIMPDIWELGLLLLLAALGVLIMLILARTLFRAEFSLFWDRRSGNPPEK